MDTETSQTLDKYAQDKYKYGFVTDIDSDRPKKGLNEKIIKFISKKKNEPEWMLTWRLDCYKKWLKMSDPQMVKLKVTQKLIIRIFIITLLQKVLKISTKT